MSPQALGKNPVEWNERALYRVGCPDPDRSPCRCHGRRSLSNAIVAQAKSKYDYDLVIIGCGVGGHGAALHAVESVGLVSALPAKTPVSRLSLT